MRELEDRTIIGLFGWLFERKFVVVSGLVRSVALSNFNERLRCKNTLLKVKTFELLDSPRFWCQDSPARNAQGAKVHAFDSTAVQWCALAALQKVYPRWQWEEKLDRALRALDVSEAGLARLTLADKMCCLMEWNDDSHSTFSHIQEILLAADL